MGGLPRDRTMGLYYYAHMPRAIPHKAALACQVLVQTQDMAKQNNAFLKFNMIHAMGMMPWANDPQSLPSAWNPKHRVLQLLER